MFKNVFGSFLRESVRVRHHVKHAPLIQTSTPASVSVRSFTDVKDEAQPPFDSSLLELLVCPLSKKPLRSLMPWGKMLFPIPAVVNSWWQQGYDAATNELINEELGIAYPITDGIPNMIPQEARLIKRDTSNTTPQ